MSKTSKDVTDPWKNITREQARKMTTENMRIRNALYEKRRAKFAPPPLPPVDPKVLAARKERFEKRRAKLEADREQYENMIRVAK